MTEVSTNDGPFRESTKPLMRPHQVEAMKEESRSLDAMMNLPPHLASSIQDRGDIIRHLKSVSRDLETQAPRGYERHDLDGAVNREALLRSEILVGMPTQAEMRRNPPGAVDKNRGWEARNKPKIQEWKNIRLRLQAGGHLDELPDARDVANLERYRPTGGAQELNLDVAQIEGKIIQLPPPGAGPAAVMSDADRAVLAEIAPDLLDSMALLSNEQRKTVLDLARAYKGLPDDDAGAIKTGAHKPKKPKTKKSKGKRASSWSPERRANASAHMKAINAARHQAAAAAEA